MLISSSTNFISPFTSTLVLNISFRMRICEHKAAILCFFHIMMKRPRNVTWHHTCVYISWPKPNGWQLIGARIIHLIKILERMLRGTVTTVILFFINNCKLKLLSISIIRSNVIIKRFTEKISSHLMKCHRYQEWVKTLALLDMHFLYFPPRWSTNQISTS